MASANHGGGGGGGGFFERCCSPGVSCPSFGFVQPASPLPPPLERLLAKDVNGNEFAYEGEVVRGQAHGQGVAFYGCGSVPYGRRDGLQHGQGRLDDTDGDVYEGGWEAGKQHGRGKCAFADGAVYEGGWRAGKQHGQGRYAWASGAVYKGQWEAGKRHGRGKYVNANGSVHHDGEWRDGNVESGDDALQPEHEVRRRRFKIFL